MDKAEVYGKLRELDSKLEGLDVDAASALLDKIISQQQSPHIIYHLLVGKAIRLASSGRASGAITLFEDCSDLAEADEGAAYYAAELLVAGHRYPEAVRYLEKAERQMAALGSNYWASCIHLLHAYCAAKLGNFTDAKLFLEKSVSEDDELTLFWVKTSPIISAKTVEALISGS